MDDATRLVIAYIASRLISGREASYVFDYGNGQTTTFTGSVSQTRVSVFDHARQCYISGTPPSLFDYCKNAYIRLTTQGSNFKGFDYASGQYFSGRTTGRSVYLFDFATSNYYNYSV